MRLSIILVLLLSLGACKTDDSSVGITEIVATAEDPCGANAAQALIGSDESVLDNIALPDSTRVIGPDTAVTLDYREDRLNIETLDGAIVRARCG